MRNSCLIIKVMHGVWPSKKWVVIAKFCLYFLLFIGGILLTNTALLSVHTEDNGAYRRKLVQYISSPAGMTV